MGRKSKRTPRKTPPTAREDKSLTRRKFLEHVGSVAGLAGLTAACGPQLSGSADAGRTDGGVDSGARDGGVDAGATDSGVDAGPARQDSPNPSVIVGIAHRLEVLDAVRRAVDLAGGLREIGPGSTVFIKPNAVYGPVMRNGIVTSKEALAAVVMLVKERNPQRIIVGDHSARGFNSTNVFASTGLGAVALAAGADEVYPAPTPIENPGAWVMLQPPGYEATWGPSGGILAMRRLVEADHLVCVPALKDHRWAQYSLSMKLMIGGIGDSSRDVLHFNLNPTTPDPERLGRDIAVLNQMFHPLINIVDGTWALISGGPDGGVYFPDAFVTHPKLAFASRDRLAVDAAALSFILLELARNNVPVHDQAWAELTGAPSPWSLPQIRHGIAFGLGASHSNAVELRFDDVRDAEAIETIFRRPT